MRIRPSRLYSSSARATGMKAVSSRSMPRNCPFGSMTPMMRNCMPPMRSRWPWADSVPNSSFFNLGPSTTSGRALSRSSGGRKLPVPTLMRDTVRIAGPTP